MISISAMTMNDTKIFYFCLGLFLFTLPSSALSTRFEADLVKAELYLVVQWQSGDDIVVLNPSFSDNHPLAKQNSFNTIQQQNGSLTEQRRSYTLGQHLSRIPEAKIKVLKSGKIMELKIESINIKQQSHLLELGLLIFVLVCVTVALLWLMKRNKSSIKNVAPSFTKESATQAVQASNWSLFFEILSSNVSWKAELRDLPVDQWQQQWQFASREPSSRDRQKIIKLLQTSTDCELREDVISEEEKILSEVLEKQ